MLGAAVVPLPCVMLLKTTSASDCGIDAGLLEVEVNVGSADVNQFNGGCIARERGAGERQTDQSGARELRILLSLWAGCYDQPYAIADLDAADTIEPKHFSEAMQDRTLR